MLRNRRSVCFAAEFSGIFYATAIWSDPVAANRLTDGDKLLELRRMAISDDAPKYTASRMIKIMVMLIKKKWPQLVRLVSYQDTEVHQGTIYKAAGWRSISAAAFSDWTTTTRKRAAPQSVAPKIRWEYEL